MRNGSAKRGLGIAQALFSGICFGFLGWFGKLAFERGVAPSELLSLRFLIGGGLLALAVLARNPRKLWVGKRTLAVCFALGIGGYAVFSSFFFNALTGLSASLTVLLLYAYPVLVAGGAWIWFGERIPRERWIALPLVMAGLAFLIWGDVYINEPVALVYGLAAAVFYSGYILCSSRWLQGVDPLASSVWIQLSAGLALAAAHWRDPQRIQQVIESAWPVLLGVALIGSILAMSFFLAALRHLPSWEVSVLSAAEPVTGVLLAILFLGEKLTALQIAGAGAVGAAFFIVSRPVSAAIQRAKPEG